MEDDDMEKLLQSYAPDVVPSLTQVRYDDWAFDGSFGWACVI